METLDNSYHKGYTHGYFAGYRDACRDMENGVNQLNIESELLSHPIETMGLCMRTFHSLERADCCYIKDIAQLQEERIIAIRNLGVKGRAEVARWLDSHGIANTAWNAFL